MPPRPTKPEPQIVIIPGEPRHVSHSHHTTVHEHRAPTDASVALLKEMEAAARDKIINAVYVGNTEFECVVHETMDNASNMMRMRAIFKLNGRQEAVEHAYRPYSDTGGVHAWRELRDKIATVIATRIIEGALSARRGLF